MASEDQLHPKTHAKELYCLTDKDLEPLSHQEKRNPYVRKGTPMKLYKQQELEEAAVQRWGSLESMEDEKQKRIAKKEKKAMDAQNDTQPDEEEEALRGDAEIREKQPSASIFSPDGTLHKLITERIKKLGGKKVKEKSGKYVLYWMSTAVRDHDNPALDVAFTEAKTRNLPLILASFLLREHTYPTHRRYKFLLEGLKDAQTSFKAKGIPHMIYLQGVSKHSEEGAFQQGFEAVLAAAADADLVVTEIMPTPPYFDLTQKLVERRADCTEVWAVDTACIVPVTLIQKAYAKAYAYRSTTQKPRKERLADIPYPSSSLQGSPGWMESAKMLPWESVNLTVEESDILSLLQRSSAVDQSVPGVNHMPGGQSAGYKRWEAFKKTGLASYAARRNNAMLRSGVSRMSAYHHFGMVSPFRIARDAVEAKGKSGDKFADEFMTWRELAYSFCFHNAGKLESFDILPAWAQKTLKAHHGDKRELKSMDAMEKGETGDAIWDALQYQLNVTGELHNNVRMTWGKAPLRWTSDPEAALKTTIHLNHKFALDGCDPSSYGGILWCFGQFDGPKGAESTPIFGSLRNRPTHWLTKKINPERFRALPVDGSGKAVEGEATGGRDIRSLFGQAGHQAPDAAQEHSSDGHSDFERGEEEDGASSSVVKAIQKRKANQVSSPKQARPQSASKITSPQRTADGSGKQAGIKSFFKRARQ